MAIYTAFFLRYESRIRRRIKEEYEKEMSKIDSDSQIQIPLTTENLLETVKRGKRVKRNRFLKYSFLNTFHSLFFIAFGLFGLHIVFTIQNYFPWPSLYIRRIAIYLTLAVVVMTLIMPRLSRRE
jgi:Na+/melibiose symporter-like transporter